jgi:hypothetical protein
MPSKEAVLAFCSAVALSAFTNLATGFDKEHHSHVRALALVPFLASSILLYAALQRNSQADSGIKSLGIPEADQDDYRSKFGVKWLQTAGFLALLAGSSLLLADAFWGR